MPQAEVTVYLSQTCPYCTMAQRLLASKRVNFTPIVVDGDPQRWTEMEARTGRSTVPQILIDAHPIGGYSDLLALDRKGELDALLFPASPLMKDAAHE